MFYVVLPGQSGPWLVPSLLYINRKLLLLNCPLLLITVIKIGHFNEYFRDCISQKVTCMLFTPKSIDFTTDYKLYVCDTGKVWFRRSEMLV